MKFWGKYVLRSDKTEKREVIYEILGIVKSKKRRSGRSFLIFLEKYIPRSKEAEHDFLDVLIK